MGLTVCHDTRFITPIFIHAGFIHIILNMLAQLTAVAQVSIVSLPAQCFSDVFLD